MSQRARPGSAQSPGSQPRLSIDGAEALHWGKKTHDDQVFLFGRMKELEEQHRDYDARIQATETIAEAAEAATSRVRRIEQQVAAIESDEQDRPFDKWAEGEISEFKSFIEKNKNVRQKMIELGDRLSRVEDPVEKANDTSHELSVLRNEIATMKRDRVSDANRIRSLESDLTSMILRIPALERASRETSSRQAPKQMLPPPSRQPPRPLSTETPDDDETEDEDEFQHLVTPFMTEQSAQGQAQVDRSPVPTTKSSGFVLPSSPTKGAGMNARLRMMQRKSINEPKRSRDPPTSVASRSRPFAAPSSLPATQIIDRQTPAMSIHGEDVSSLHSTRAPPTKSRGVAPSSVSRSFIQANDPPATQIVKKPTAITKVKHDKVSPTKAVSKAQPSAHHVEKIPTRKRKLDDTAFSPPVTRSQGKSQDTIHVQVSAAQGDTSTVEDHANKEPAAKRKRGNDTSSKTSKGTNVPAKAALSAASLVKSSPRKVAPTTASVTRTSPQKRPGPKQRKNCDSCSRRHKKCDHARPACSECTKLGRPENCVYPDPPEDQDQLVAPLPSSPVKKPIKPSKFILSGSPQKPTNRTGFHDDPRASSKTLSAAHTSSSPMKRSSSPIKTSSSPAKASSSRQKPRVAPSSRRAAVQNSTSPPPPSARPQQQVVKAGNSPMSRGEE